MYDPIRTAFESLLRTLRPGVGRHRAGRTAHAPATPALDARAARPPRVRVEPAAMGPVLRGEDTALVRPYLLAYEERSRRQEQRRERTYETGARA